MASVKRPLVIVAVVVASLATFPFSVPVLIVAWIVHRYRKERAIKRHYPSTATVYQYQLEYLENALREAVRESELMARIKYTVWKIKKEKEKQYYIAHGVTFPATPLEIEQDRIFGAMERRLEQERLRFEEETRRIEREERRKLEDQRRQEEDGRLEAQRHELELARIQAERQAAEMMARTLREDLA